ncbi:MAG: hypothetical protein ACOC1H_00460 [Desulfosalsimonas sp.]
MNLKISTKRHCIETEVKHQYNRAVSKYFKASAENEKKDLENRIDLLHHAIETLDFSFLRSRYPDLRGDSSAEIRLLRNDAGAIGITINGEEIETTNPN